MINHQRRFFCTILFMGVAMTQNVSSSQPNSDDTFEINELPPGIKMVICTEAKKKKPESEEN